MKSFILVLSIISGYIFIPLVISSSSVLNQAIIKWWSQGRYEPKQLSNALAKFSSLIFMIFTFFGFGLIWIEFMSGAQEDMRGVLGRLWVKGYFCGLIFGMLTPVIDGFWSKLKNGRSTGSGNRPKQ